MFHLWLWQDHHRHSPRQTPQTLPVMTLPLRPPHLSLLCCPIYCIYICTAYNSIGLSLLVPSPYWTVLFVSPLPHLLLHHLCLPSHPQEFWMTSCTAKLCAWMPSRPGGTTTTSTVFMATQWSWQLKSESSLDQSHLFLVLKCCVWCQTYTEWILPLILKSWVELIGFTNTIS